MCPCKHNVSLPRVKMMDVSLAESNARKMVPKNPRTQRVACDTSFDSKGVLVCCYNVDWLGLKSGFECSRGTR